MSALNDLVIHISKCRICCDTPLRSPLSHAPRPVLQVSSTAKICICGQAPGTRVHASGRPFTDPSGERLRHWLGINNDIFYDTTHIAIVPMGFCFPGLNKKGGDLPPRTECRLAWHGALFSAMPQLELIIAVGLYAQAYHLGDDRKPTLSETVRAWPNYLTRKGKPAVFPLPHPSWRNNVWLKKNPWFEHDLLPELRNQVRQLIFA